jgi:cardiolipin synthase
MLGLAFHEISWITNPVGWAFGLWGAFLYWWAGFVYILETARVIRIPLGASPAASDTLGG